MLKQLRFSIIKNYMYFHLGFISCYMNIFLLVCLILNLLLLHIWHLVIPVIHLSILCKTTSMDMHDMTWHDMYICHHRPQIKIWVHYVCRKIFFHQGWVLGFVLSIWISWKTRSTLFQAMESSLSHCLEKRSGGIFKTCLITCTWIISYFCHKASILQD